MEEFSLGNALKADWQPLGTHLSAPVLAEILDGGQSFRWHAIGDQRWRGQWLHHAVELRVTEPDHPEWRPLTEQTTQSELRRYLALDEDFAALTDALPWRSDPILAAAISTFPGLRILRQDLREALIGFICSSSKRIAQIKQAVGLIAAQFGPEIAPGLHALPSWSELAAVSEDDLRACKLGYRARYLAQTAQILAADPEWADRLATLPYPAAHAALMRLPGVGAKVADCVLLFGTHRLEAFPVDTWIVQAMSRWYGLADWRPQQVAHFGRIHFGPAAGLAQQFLFAAARRGVPLN